MVPEKCRPQLAPSKSIMDDHGAMGEVALILFPKQLFDQTLCSAFCRLGRFFQEMIAENRLKMCQRLPELPQTSLSGVSAMVHRLVVGVTKFVKPFDTIDTKWSNERSWGL